MDQKCFSAGRDFPPLRKGLLRLYNMRFCSYAHRTRLVLAHLNIPHEVINIDLRSKPEWFLERNPRGMVPVLEYDGKIVPESVDCCEYLDEVYNANQLSAKDSYRRNRDKLLIENFSRVTGPYYPALFSCGKDQSVVNSFHDGLHTFETELKDRGGTYFGGENPMLIDCILYPHMERIAVVHNIAPALELSRDRYPFLKSWIQRMQTLPAVKQTRFPDEVHIEYLRKYAKGTEDYDTGL